MPTPLRILILEDVPANAEVMTLALQTEGFDITAQRVETQDAFLKALASPPLPDVILSDYHLPTFDGFSALALAQRHGADIPFILVSGVLGEEMAIDALKRGATDYVLKQRLSRIGPVVRRALQEAEDRRARRQAERFKDELLSVLAHELRTPLAVVQEGISQFSDGVLGPITEEQRASCQTITESVARLSGLLDKVLLATKILAGQLVCSKTPMNVEALIGGVVEPFARVAEIKQITLRTVPGKLVGPYSGDRARLAQALGQLVENAIQATPDGGTVTVTAAGGRDGVALTVQDTGRGIPAEEIPTLFQRFRWIGGPNERKTGGLGLGLFIARSIIALHGGSVAADSAVGQGTRITVTLPGLPSSP